METINGSNSIRRVIEFVALILAASAMWCCQPDAGVAAAAAPASAGARSSGEMAGPCGTRDTEACLEHAKDLYLGRNGRAVNVVAAVPLLEAACDRVGKGACALLGQAQFMGEAPLKQDKSKAAALFKKGCAKGEAASCINLAQMYAGGVAGLKGGKDATVPYYHKASGFIRAGCNAGKARECYTAGTIYEGLEWELKPDPATAKALYAKARELAEKGCPAGGAEDCHTLALLHYQRKLKRDAEVSVPALFAKACHAKHGEACTALGILHRDGEEGLAKDEGQALEHLQQACSVGEPTGCYLAALIQDNSDQLKDAPAAAKNYEAGCKRREARACNNLGVFYAHGQGGKTKNTQKALTLYERACDLGNTKGCENLAQLRTSTKREEAAAPFRASIQVGSQSHCGLVIEVKRPIALVQTMVGQVWIRVDQLYQPGKANCRFHNGQYVEP